MARTAEHDAFTRTRTAHWNAVADHERRRLWSRGYYRRLETIMHTLVPPESRVLEVGCGSGDLLAALRPRLGIGVDFSIAMVARARRRHPELRFVVGDAHELPLRGEFDAILVSDLANDLWDVQRVLEQLLVLSHPDTRLLINVYSRLWEPPLRLARRLGLARPLLSQSWLTPDDIADLGGLAGFEIVRHTREVLCPIPLPLLEPLANRALVRLWPLGHLALTNVLVARPHEGSLPAAAPPRVSVIIPARNESGNIEAAIERTPEIAGGTELVFVEGNSTDDTWDAIQRAIVRHPERRCLALRQPGVGKGDAVRAGFAAASGEVLIILDADLTVAPEDLPRFVEVVTSGKGDLANGVRLVYPMADRAMRFFNTLGNKLFSVLFSWLLGQPIKDTLCGTKALHRKWYERIAGARHHLGTLDPFGDFDLLLGGARLGMKIVGVPIRYGERTYGDTNIRRWSHGLLLFRMLLRAARTIKFS